MSDYRVAGKCWTPGAHPLFTATPNLLDREPGPNGYTTGWTARSPPGRRARGRSFEVEVRTTAEGGLPATTAGRGVESGQVARLRSGPPPPGDAVTSASSISKRTETSCSFGRPGPGCPATSCTSTPCSRGTFAMSIRNRCAASSASIGGMSDPESWTRVPSGRSDPGSRRGRDTPAGRLSS